jgi:REP element-mobilizing transposase RayT
VRASATPRTKKHMANAFAYFITFSCYGSHLHGADSGSVDRNHNAFNGRYVAPNAARRAAEEARMEQAPYHLDAPARDTVLQSIQEVCSHRGWKLIAAHVRTTHVHLVVEADKPPEAVMHDFKAYAARLLNQRETNTPETKRWTRHGSTRYLWKDDEVAAAVDYVIAGQGEPMAVFPILARRTAP